MFLFGLSKWISKKSVSIPVTIQCYLIIVPVHYLTSQHSCQCNEWINLLCIKGVTMWIFVPHDFPPYYKKPSQGMPKVGLDTEHVRRTQSGGHWHTGRELPWEAILSYLNMTALLWKQLCHKYVVIERITIERIWIVKSSILDIDLSVKLKKGEFK